MRFPGERPDASSPALSLLSPFFSPRAGVPAVAAVAFGVRQRGGETFFPAFKRQEGEERKRTHQRKNSTSTFFHPKKKSLSHSRWDSYFDSKRKVSVPGRGRFCVYQRGGVVSAASNPNSSASSNSASAAASSSAAGGGDTAVSPAPPWGASTSEQQQLQLPVVFCHHGAGYTGLSWALVAAQMGPG